MAPTIFDPCNTTDVSKYEVCLVGALNQAECCTAHMEECKLYHQCKGITSYAGAENNVNVLHSGNVSSALSNALAQSLFRHRLAQHGFFLSLPNAACKHHCGDDMSMKSEW